MTGRLASPLDERFAVRVWTIDELLAGSLPDGAGLAPGWAAASALAWLSPDERDLHGRFRSPERQRTFLAGRIGIKRGLLPILPAGEFSGVTPAEMHVASRDAQGRPSRPVVSVRGTMLPWQLSLSHAVGRVAVGWAREPGDGIGVDLAPDAPLGAGFQQTWFTPAEQAWAASSGDPMLAAKIWSAKEAAYKAANAGQPFVPAEWEIRPDRTDRADSAGSWTFAARPAVAESIGELEVCQRDDTIFSIARVSAGHFGGRLLPNPPRAR